MRFAQDLAYEAGDKGEEEFKKLAADMVASFARMRREEMLGGVQLRACRITDAEGIGAGRRIAEIENTANAYVRGDITLLQAKRRFEGAVPALADFLVQEVLHDEEGKRRALPFSVLEAVEYYQMQPTWKHASELVSLCAADASLGTHWMFDNLARAVVFCDHAADRGRRL